MASQQSEQRELIVIAKVVTVLFQRGIPVFRCLKRLGAVGTITLPFVALAFNANAEVYTLTFDGNSNLVGVKSYKLPSFKNIKKVRMRFQSSSPLSSGTCWQFQAGSGTAGSWRLISFTDGVNTYTQAKGFSSPLSTTWGSVHWLFEACLNSASQLTTFNGQVWDDNSSLNPQSYIEFENYVTT